MSLRTTEEILTGKVPRTIARIIAEAANHASLQDLPGVILAWHGHGIPEMYTSLGTCFSFSLDLSIRD